MKKFLAYLVTLVLVAGIGVGAYFLFRKPAEATSVMTMSVNPEVQFILDQNNKVMNVTAVNEDGTSLLTQVKFEGMKAEDAAKLFVEVSNQMGKVSLDASVSANKEVKIYISCDENSKTSESIKNLQTNVLNSVNQYFKDNGIINGAKVFVEDMSGALNKFGSQIEEYTGSTFEEAMAYVKEVNKQFKDVSFEVRSTLQSTINALKNSAQSGIELLKNKIKDLQKLIDSAKESLNNSKLLTEEAKKEINKNISEWQTQLNNAQKELDKQLNELQAKIDAEVKKFQEQCKQTLETLKDEIKTQIEEGKKTIENHKKAFEQKTAEEKQAIIDQIEAFQNSLANNAA